MIFQSTKKSPHFKVQNSLRAIALIAIPGFLWIGAVYLRPTFVSLRCGIQPEFCTPSSVFWLDRFSLGLNSSEADGISFLAQNITGALSFTSVIVLCAIGIIRSKERWPHSIEMIGLWVKAVLWTGLLTEGVRLLVQRPRPFVYGDPGVLGMNPAHYTSFFSGHTSFATASGVIAILLMRDQQLPKILYRGFAGVVAVLIFTTGICRILSGRHFLTDVLASIAAGTFVAWTIHQNSQTRKTRILHVT